MVSASAQAHMHEDLKTYGLRPSFGERFGLGQGEQG
jgi:hypothetical protein